MSRQELADALRSLRQLRDSSRRDARTYQTVAMQNFCGGMAGAFHIAAHALALRFGGRP